MVDLGEIYLFYLVSLGATNMIHFFQYISLKTQKIVVILKYLTLIIILKENKLKIICVK